MCIRDRVYQCICQQSEVGAGTAVFSDRTAFLQQNDLCCSVGEVERVGFFINLFRSIKIILFDLPDIDAVVADFTIRHLVETIDQVGNCLLYTSQFRRVGS